MTQNKYLIFLCSFIMMFLFLHVNEYRHISDDIWFAKKAIEEPDHLKWVISRYYDWSSRSPIEYALISLIDKYMSWSIINSIAFATLLTSLSYFSNYSRENKELLHSAIAIAMCILLMPRNIFFDGMVWMTGSFNYLWPVSIATVAYAVLFRLAVSGIENRSIIWVGIFSFALSSFNEQIAITNVIMIVLAFAYCKANKLPSGKVLTMFIPVFIIMLYIVTCPGNNVRYNSEVTKWFSNYKDLSFIQKSMLGLNLYADSLLSHKTLTPAIMAITACLACKNNLRIIPLLASMALIIFAIVYSSPEILSKTRFNSDTIYSSQSILRVIISLIITAMIVMPVVISQWKSPLSFISLGIFASAIASASVLGFSPTVYASGDRVLYVTYIMFSLFAGLCVAERNIDK